MTARKLALVTGASGGLGLEFARLFARDDYDLALVARSGDKLARIATELQAAHGVAVSVVVQDLGAADAAAAVLARVPACDVLVNNAGFAGNGRLDTIPAPAVREEVAVDVLALTELTRAYLPGMIARRAGTIFNIASTAGFLPGPFMATYYASKAFVISFSEALWEELRGTGVRVTCFCPGATATGFAERAQMHRTMLFKLPVGDAAAVARDGYRAMQRGKRLHVAWPPSNWAVPWLARFSPRGLLLRVSRATVQPATDVKGA